MIDTFLYDFHVSVCIEVKTKKKIRNLTGHVNIRCVSINGVSSNEEEKIRLTMSDDRHIANAISPLCVSLFFSNYLGYIIYTLISTRVNNMRKETKVEDPIQQLLVNGLIIKIIVIRKIYKSFGQIVKKFGRCSRASVILLFVAVVITIEIKKVETIFFDDGQNLYECNSSSWSLSLCSP